VRHLTAIINISVGFYEQSSAFHIQQFYSVIKLPVD